MLLPTDQLAQPYSSIWLDGGWLSKDHKPPEAGKRASIIVLPAALCFITIPLQKLRSLKAYSVADIFKPFYVEHNMRQDSGAHMSRENEAINGTKLCWNGFKLSTHLNYYLEFHNLLSMV